MSLDPVSLLAVMPSQTCFVALIFPLLILQIISCPSKLDSFSTLSATGKLFQSNKFISNVNSLGNSP